MCVPQWWNEYGGRVCSYIEFLRGEAPSDKLFRHMDFQGSKHERERNLEFISGVWFTARVSSFHRGGCSPSLQVFRLARAVAFLGYARAVQVEADMK